MSPADHGASIRRTRRPWIKRPRAADSTALRPPLLLLAFGSALFTGYVPVASGTVGSAVAVLLWWIIPGTEHPGLLGAMALVALVAGIPAASAMERVYGDDPSQVVIDEVAGQWIALLFLPKTWLAAVLAFAAFRAFDILKPPPVRQLDAMHGGTGIMLDDAAAGLYALLAVHIVFALAGSII